MSLAFLTKALRAKWEKLGFTYYHTDKDGVREVFFLNKDAKSTIVFKSTEKGRMLLDTTNLTITAELDDLIDETRKELGLL